MRKFLALQWIFLVIGISVLMFSEFNCKLPQCLLNKLKFRLHAEVQNIYIKSCCITLLNVHYKNFFCKRLEIRWKALFKDWQCFIEEGQWSFRNENFYAINGCLYGKFGKIRGFLDLKNDFIKTIRISCSDFIKISEIFTEVQQASTIKIPTVDHLILSITAHPKQAVVVYGECRNLFGRDASIRKLRFVYPWNGKDFFKLWGNEVAYKQWVFQKSFLKAIHKNDFFQLEDVAFLGNLNVDMLQNLSVFLKSKQFNIKETNGIELAGFASNLNFSGKGNLNLITRAFDFYACRGQVVQAFDEFLEKYPIVYSIAGTQPLFFSTYGSLNDFGITLYSRNFFVNNEQFSAIQALGYYQKQQLSGNLKLYGDHKWLDSEFRYDWAAGNGFLGVDGCLSPELTYPLKDFFPRWWQPFFEDFQFYKNFPKTNFAFHCDKDFYKCLLYGNVSANEFRYKTSNVKFLNLVFGYRPGYCLFDIKALKTQEGEGCCTISWPYSCKNDYEECWKFKGNGKFNVVTWETLVNDFVEQTYCHKIAEQFQENSLIHTTFRGVLYPETNAQENLKLVVDIPKTILYHFPIQNLKFCYNWTPKQFSIDSAKGILFDSAPFEGQYACQQKKFNFDLKTHDLQTSELLKHPLLKEWNDAIPEKNRSTYTGKLNLALKGSGDFEQNLHLSGQGWAQFDNPQLSQIHLLGPLQNLFLRQFKWRPTIELDRLVSEFSFTEKQISSKNTILSGSSTRANLTGELKLDTCELAAKVYFSFLDYQQLKLPVMKQLFQLFQPISKGFAASVGGTFENPQWRFTFNPLRFVLPQKTIREKRKKLALQKQTKSVD